MASTILVMGGARSGKSRLAEELARAHGAPLAYIATGSAGDAEMAARIARHQGRRGADWTTVEEPLELVAAIRQAAAGHRAILVDCLTLWLSNLLLRYEPFLPQEELASRVLAHVAELTEQLRRTTVPVVLVASEVGMGIVPENRLARLFRDLAGETNEMVAAAADQVHVCFAGIPMKIKG
jgi:adenosylcobinamide kinase/adenosylcobinamide-phosphate guanylyltransferase